MNDDLDTSAEACAVACMLVSNPAGETRHVGWQKEVNDLIRALLHERDAARAELADVKEDLLSLVEEVELWCEAVGRDSSWDGWDHHYKAIKWETLPAIRARIEAALNKKGE